MPKPDFFLPFHLPMIRKDYDILNIDCDLLKNYSVKEHYNPFYFKLYFDHVLNARLANGVYQTMSIASGISYYDTLVKINPFSISLN